MCHAARYRAELGTNRLVHEEIREVVTLVENKRLRVGNHSQPHHTTWMIAAYHDQCHIA